MESPLFVLSDLSERLQYNINELPLYTKKDELRRYGYEALCHWHPDLEFIYIVQGTMDYFINGKKIRLLQGQGVFVNSRRLHYGFSKEKNDCIFIALVIHPDIFTSATEVARNFAEIKFSARNIDYIILYPHVPWQKAILDRIVEIHNYINTTPLNPIRLLASADLICADISDHIETVGVSEKENHMQMSFLKMTEFIHDNYQEKITIEQIANAGAVCRSKGCQLFQQYVRQTPNTYLKKYRLSKSAELLRDTDLSVTEIALICGFQTASYYISAFKQETGETPLHYRGLNKYID